MFQNVWVPQNVFFGRPDKLTTCVAAKGVLLEDLVHGFRATTQTKVEHNKSVYIYIRSSVAPP